MGVKFACEVVSARAVCCETMAHLVESSALGPPARGVFYFQGCLKGIRDMLCTIEVRVFGTGWVRSGERWDSAV
jgi:hypothetical protein